MTGDAIISEAWGMIGDIAEDAHKRNQLADMIGYLNDGIVDLIARRPHTLLQADGTLTTFTELTADTYDTQELPFDESLREGMAHYIAFRTFNIDSSDEHNAKQAKDHRNLYLSQT